MNKEDFITYIKSLQEINGIQNKLRGTGICIIDYSEHFYKALGCLERSLFEEWSIDLIHDFVLGEKPITIYRSKTKEIIFVIDSPEKLWQYIEENMTEKTA